MATDQATNPYYESRSYDPSVTAATRPLRPIDWDLYATLDDLRRWPPSRFASRNERLDHYQTLYRGDYTNMVATQDAVRVRVNYHRRLVTLVAGLLTTVDPVQTPELVDPQALTVVASELLVDQLRYGGAIVRCGLAPDIGPYIDVLDPTAWYPLEDGGHLIVSPYVSATAQDANPDRARVTIIDNRGTTSLFDYSWSGSTLGDQLDTGTSLGWSVVERVTMLPRVPGWGTSWYDDLTPLVVELARRLTSASSILDAHERPLLSTWVDDQDLSAFLPDDPNPPLGNARRGAAVPGLEDWRRHDIVSVPNQLQRYEYITWDGQLSASINTIEQLRMSIHVLTAIPAILEAVSGVPSGVALKRLLLPLYAVTRSLQSQTRLALEAVLSGIGQFAGYGDIRVEWPHAFDALDEEARANRPDMTRDPDAEATDAGDDAQDDPDTDE